MRICFVLVFLSVLSSNNVHSKEFSIMSYNLENLFDTTHDFGKDDYTYLPKEVKDNSQDIQNHCKSLSRDFYIKSCLNVDWTTDKLNQKLKNLSKVIKLYNFGQGADILVFQEIENQNVMNLFMRKELRSLGYKYSVVLEGEDSRGIDNGIVSKYPIINQKIHKINLNGIAKKTRGILQADVLINDKIVSVLGNHWPSQGNPTLARAKAAKTMNKIAKKLNYSSSLVVALGDFNTVPDRDIPNPLETITEKVFVNAETVARKMGKTIHDGTHWFAGKWGSLDKIYIMKSSLNKVHAKFYTFDIIVENFMLGEKIWTDRDSGDVTVYQDVPIRFSFNNATGYSDHLPIVMRFDI